MPTDNRVALRVALPVVLQEPRPSLPRARVGIVLALGLALVALVETAQALIAPGRAPTASDWVATAAEVRSGFHAGDLIVASPSWADPVMRMYLGDLLPVRSAARMDDARFGRVWEVSQHGARAPEDVGRNLAFERRFGALTLRRLERRPAEITFDFLDRWQEAVVTRWDPVLRVSSPCPWQADRFACPISGNSVQRALVEVDNRIRRALLAPPVVGAIIAVEFPAVPLGRELAVAAGLHDTWARKSPGSVHVEIWVGGRPVANTTVDNRSGWRQMLIDTSTRDGQTASVRLQISSPVPVLRHLAFAAEARR